MGQDSTTTPTPPAGNLLGIADILWRQYGPYAFGAVLLLMLWRWVVGPELAANRAAMATVATALTSAESTARASSDAARASKEAAEIMRATLDAFKELEGKR